MPDCNETIRELEIFLDDELSDDARSAIHGHLQGCTDCIETFEFHAELKAVIARKCNNDEMPPSLLARIEKCFDTDFDDDGEVGAPD